MQVPETTGPLNVHSQTVRLLKLAAKAHKPPGLTPPGLPVSPWQPFSCLFMLLRTLKYFPQPWCLHLYGFSPVCEYVWILSELGREKGLLQVGQTYRSWAGGYALVADGGK